MIKCSFTNKVVLGSNPVTVTYISDFEPVSSKELTFRQLQSLDSLENTYVI